MRRTIALSIFMIAAVAGNLFAVTEGRISGTVVDASTKAPIANATITVNNIKGAGHTFNQKYKTAKDGSYAIFLLDATTPYDFVFEAPGYTSQTLPAKKLAVGGTIKEDISMVPAGAATPAAAQAGAPDPAVVAYNAGATLANEGKVDEAIAKIEEAMKIRPDLPAGPSALAHLYLQTKNYPKAIENAQKALTIDADDSEMNPILAQAYAATGDKTKAAEYNSKLPANPTALFNDAAKLINAQHDDQAEPLLKQAIGADPKFARAYYELGMLYVRTGKSADAKTNLQKYLELEPNGKDATTAKEMLNYVK
jgi:tetratricopeptide (TPR) repeat protein